MADSVGRRRAAPSVKVLVRRALAPVASAVTGTRFEDLAYWIWHKIVREGPSANVEYDRLTVSVIERVLTPSGNGIDIGAHRGTVLRHIVSASPAGRHFAIEPLPAFAAGLRRRFPKVDVREVALAGEPGQAVFHHVVTNPSYSGLSQRDYPGNGEVLHDLVVQVERLDDVVPADLPVHFVKVDVEGGELAVLEGGRSLLRRWHPVVVLEHGWKDGVSDDPPLTEGLWRELSGAGLGVYRLRTWLDNGPALSRDGFDEALRSGEYYFLAAPAQ